jgi:hypothetical protein
MGTCQWEMPNTNYTWRPQNKKEKENANLSRSVVRPPKGTGAHSNTTCPLRSTRCQFFNLPRKIHWCTPRNRSQSTRIPPPLPERPYMDPVHGRNRHGARSAESLGAMHRVQPNSPGHDHADPFSTGTRTPFQNPWKLAIASVQMEFS